LTGRERMMAALRRQPVDRIPWSPLVDYYLLNSLPPGSPTDKVALCRRIGADIFDWHPQGRQAIYRDVSITSRQEAQQVVVTTIETPVGVLTERRVATPHTTFITEPKIKSAADIAPYRFWIEHTETEPDYASFLASEAVIGDDGLAILCGPQSPAQFLLGEDIGLENFYYLLNDHSREMEALFASMHEKNKQVYRILAASPAVAVLAPEDVSTSTMSPDVCARYTMRYLDDYARIVHAAGKLLIGHMCGLLKGMAPLIARSRLDGIESLTPPTTGDFPVDEARKAWPDKVIIGGLEPKSLVFLSVSEIVAYVRDVLRRAAPGDGFILSTGDTTAYGTPLENLEAVSATVKQFGRY